MMTSRASQEYAHQPRSQGLSPLPPLVVGITTKGGREERPWERGCMPSANSLKTLQTASNTVKQQRIRQESKESLFYSQNITV